MAKLERFYPNCLVSTLSKTKTHKILNPKRLKIIVGIILIFLFGLALDFLYPLSLEPTKIDIQIEKAKVQVEYLSGLIDEYYEIHGEYPPILLGGDAEGYKIAHLKNYDPLISSGIIDSYPIVNRDSIAEERAFISLVMKSNIRKWLLGKSGNRIANVGEILRDDYAYENFRNSNVNPFAGMFMYNSVITSKKPGYDLFIMGNTFDKSFCLNEKTRCFQSPHYDPSSNYSIPGMKGGFIYGILVRHENGIPTITKYEYGVD